MTTSHHTVWDVHEGPLGQLTLQASRRGMSGLRFPGHGDPMEEAAHDPAALAPAKAQLEEYLAGRRRSFDVVLDLAGTPFQREVWQQLLRIPYGTTVSYTALARAVGRPNSVRAVAAAVARTPVPIVIPCHRVVGAGGQLTGYLGGLERKRALLDLERAGPAPAVAA